MADEDKRNSQTLFTPHPDYFKPLYPTYTQFGNKKPQKSGIPSLSAKHDSLVSYAQQQQWGPFGM